MFSFHREIFEKYHQYLVDKKIKDKQIIIWMHEHEFFNSLIHQLGFSRFKEIVFKEIH